MLLQKKKKHEYMKFYNFLLLTKWKGKKWLMKDKVRIENIEIKVIKWERKSKIVIEKRKRERVTDYTCCDYKPSH